MTFKKSTEVKEIYLFSLIMKYNSVIVIKVQHKGFNSNGLSCLIYVNKCIICIIFKQVIQISIHVLNGECCFLASIKGHCQRVVIISPAMWSLSY